MEGRAKEPLPDGIDWLSSWRSRRKLRSSRLTICNKLRFRLSDEPDCGKRVYDADSEASEVPGEEAVIRRRKQGGTGIEKDAGEQKRSGGPGELLGFDRPPMPTLRTAMLQRDGEQYSHKNCGEGEFLTDCEMAPFMKRSIME